MSRYLRLFTVLIVLALFSAPAVAQEPEPTTGQGTNQVYLPFLNGSGQQPEQPSTEDDQNRDAMEYAKMFGVNLDEAIHRLALQDTAGDLNFQLSTNEVDTFAGLWIQHTPTFKVIVKFVGDGEKTIRHYIENSPLENLIEIHPATVSLASLVVEQEAAMELIRDSIVVF